MRKAKAGAMKEGEVRESGGRVAEETNRAEDEEQSC